MGNPYTIRCEWDEEEEVWHAASTEIPELAIDAPTIGAMTELLHDAIPRALDARGIEHDPDIPFEVVPCSLRTTMPSSV